MARSEVLRDQDALRQRAQLLADQIFRPHSKRNVRNVQHTANTKRFNRRRAEELAVEILGHKHNFKTERRERRMRKQLAEKRKQESEEQSRCWNWIFHLGNVHYACNGSAFTSYTKLSPANSVSLGLGPHGALGIGTVNLVAPRAYGAPDMCTITLYDVLHMPHMPCNGISIPRFVGGGMEVLQGGGRTVITHGSKGHLLLEGREMPRTFWHRLCLVGEPEDEGLLHGLQGMSRSRWTRS